MKNNRLVDLYLTIPICLASCVGMAVFASPVIQKKHQEDQVIQEQADNIVNEEKLKQAEIQAKKQTAQVAANNQIPIYNTLKDLSYSKSSSYPPSKQAIDAIDWKDKKIGYRDKFGVCVGYVKGGVLYVEDTGEWTNKPYIKIDEDACKWANEGTQ